MSLSKSQSSKRFAINLLVSMEDKGAGTSGSEAFARSLATLAGHIQALGGALPAYKPYVPIKFENQVRVLLDATHDSQSSSRDDCTRRKPMSI